MQRTLRLLFTSSDAALLPLSSAPDLAVFSSSNGVPPDLPACLSAMASPSITTVVDIPAGLSGCFVPSEPTQVSLTPLLAGAGGKSLTTTSASRQPGSAAQALRKAALGGKLTTAEANVAALGGLPPTCAASPLVDASRRSRPPPFFPPNSAKSGVSALQFRFLGGQGVPGPGGGFTCEGRSLRVCLLDVFSMKFVGPAAHAPVQRPTDGSRTASATWAPTAAGSLPFLSLGDLALHPQLHLYLELCQSSSRVHPTGGGTGTVTDVSCGHALVSLKDIIASYAGERELAVSGGTPFKPRPIKQGVTWGPTLLKVKFEPVETHLQGASTPNPRP